MRKSYRSIVPKGLEDYLRELCVIYRGEIDNPHDINAILDEERKIQILRYHLWDAERSILEAPGSWRYLYLEEKGSLPVDDESIARRLYDFAVKKKLERVKEFGIDLIPLQNSIEPRQLIALDKRTNNAGKFFATMPHKTGTTEVYRSIPIDMNFRYGGLLYESASSLDGSDRSFCYLYYTNIALSNKVEAENLPLPITGTTRKVGLM